MIFQIVEVLLLGQGVFCVNIDPGGCEKVESKQLGFLNTYISKDQNAQCKGQLRFRKHGKVFCLQKQESWDDYFQCPSNDHSLRNHAPITYLKIYTIVKLLGLPIEIAIADLGS